MLAQDSYTDEELLALLKQGKVHAFEQIYHRYWKLLFSIAANKLGDIPDTEEVVQDVFADLWKRREEIEITHSIKSFLAGAVKFRVYTTLAARYRLNKKKEGLGRHQEADFAIAADEIYRLKVLQEQILSAAGELPDRCRLIYQLSRESGYTNKQIAHELRISEKTVESQITRALKHIRSVLQGLLSSFF